MLRISIITITFNAAEALRKTIDSVNAQTYPEVEHVIVDGGSKDESTNIIARSARRQVRWVSESDKGISDAFNKGTAMATGDFLCYLNAGDVFASPTVLRQAAEAIGDLGSDSLNIFHGYFCTVNESVVRLHTTSSRLEDFEWENPINHQSTFVPRELARRYPYDQRLRMGMDYEFWLRVRHEVAFHRLEFAVAIFALDGRSNDPAWSVDRLVIQRALWHINVGRRVEVADVWQMTRRVAELKVRYLVRCILGRSIMTALRRRKAKAEMRNFSSRPNLSVSPHVNPQ